MSSRGTIFLTNKNEHVYDETNDWSIVLEINVSSIDKIEIVKDISVNHEWEIYDKEYEDIIIQTRSNYAFTDLLSIEHDTNIIELWLSDCQDIGDQDKDIKCSSIKIYISKKSEWMKEYKKALSSRLGSLLNRVLSKVDKLLN